METISIALVCTIGGAIISYLSFERKKHNDIRADTREETEGMTKITQEIKYVSKGVDDIKYDLRDINKNMSDMSEKVIRLEESCKSAHKRIDNLE